MALSKVLRAGVVGAGVFGGYHAGQYARIEGAELAAIYDPHAGRARALADKHGARVVERLEALWPLVDVATIASPATAHSDEALAGLAAGVALYVEKPIATSLEASDR